MIIYVPYEDLNKCAKVLSEEVLRFQIKSILETLTVLKNKSNPLYSDQGYLMWVNFESLLKTYYNILIKELGKRQITHKYKPMEITSKRTRIPWFFGVKEFHDSHKAAIIRVMVNHLEIAIKNKQNNYIDISNRYFASYAYLHEHCKWPGINPDTPYYWPTKIK